MDNPVFLDTIFLARIWHRSGAEGKIMAESQEHRGGGNKKGTRASFGNVRKLRSGRFQARFTGPDGQQHLGPTTFETKGDAQAWLAIQSAAITEHRWRPPAPEAPQDLPTFKQYSTEWLAARELKPRTRDEYRKMLGLPKPGADEVAAPTRKGTRRATTLFERWGEVPLDLITASDVRAWYAQLDPTKPTQRAHLYALLRTVLGTAVEHGLLDVNPCTVRGAGRTKRVRRIEPATIEELAAIQKALDPRYHALVDVAAWCALRWGELTELRRKDLDLTKGVVRVRRGVTWVAGESIVGPPKSSAGVRDVTIPPHIIDGLTSHLKEYSEPGAEGLVFPAHGGGHLSHGTFYKHWRKARAAAGRPDLRLHDARHTGAVMAAMAGATLRELMDRLGHSSPATALLYQHTADGRAQELARKLSQMAQGGGAV